MRLRNSTASGPWTSILPSVEASIFATDSRAAAHSRRTAASMSSPVAREEAWPLPLADVLEHGAGLDVRRLDRRHAHRVEELAAVAARQERERDRQVRRPEGRRPELAGMHLQQFCRDADRVHVRELALLGAGADRRVALDVLDGAKPGADRAAHVGDGRVALEIDEHRVLVAVRQREGGRVGQPLPGQAADALDPGELAVRHGRADAVVPAKAAARLAPEVDPRAPASGHRRRSGWTSVLARRRSRASARARRCPGRSPAARSRRSRARSASRGSARPAGRARRRSRSCRRRARRPTFPDGRRRGAPGPAPPRRPRPRSGRRRRRARRSGRARVVARVVVQPRPGGPCRPAARRRGRPRARRASRAASAWPRSAPARSAPPRPPCRRRAAGRDRASGSRRGRRCARAPPRGSRPRGLRTQFRRT